MVAVSEETNKGGEGKRERGKRRKGGDTMGGEFKLRP